MAARRAELHCAIVSALLEMEKLSHANSTDDFTMDWLKDKIFQTTQLESHVRVKLSTLTTNVNEFTQKMVLGNERTAVLQQYKSDIRTQLEKHHSDRTNNAAAQEAARAVFLLQKEEADPLNKSVEDLRTSINKLTLERDEMKIQLLKLKSDGQNKHITAVSPKQPASGKKG